MDFSFEYLFLCLESGLKSLPMTLFIGFGPLIVGFFFAFFVALVRFFRVPVLSEVFRVLTTIYVGVPEMVALLLYYLLYLKLFPPFEYGALLVAFFSLTLKKITYLSETIRGALISIPKIQFEASYACGLSIKQTLLKIVFPQMVPVAIPPLTNQIVGGVKNTSIVMVVGIMDVLNGSAIPCADTYSYVEGYVAAAIIYWLLSILEEFVLGRIGKYFSKGKAEVSF